MKKYLSLILRTLVAVAGIAYIVYVVDWYDQIEFPVGTVLPNGQVLDQPAKFKVVQGTYDPSNPSGQVTVQLPKSAQAPDTLSVSQADFDAGPKSPKFVRGFIPMLPKADKSMLLMGLLVVGGIYPILMVRWWMLLRVRGIDVPIWKAFRLTMVGNFFNFCMPGTTGGDVIKAYYAAKGSQRRAEAVMTVIVDRVCGLTGLLVLAGFAGLFVLHDEVARSITFNIWLISAGACVGAAVYFSRRLRAALGVDWLLVKLPAKRFFASIDEAAFSYRGHINVVFTAVFMSVGIHISLVLATAAAGYALGIQTPLGLLMIVIPVTFLIGALPIAPQGIGVMEFFAVTMLAPSGALANQVVGMLIMIRVYQMVYSLVGSVFLLKGDIHLHPQIDSSHEADTHEPPPIV